MFEIHLGVPEMEELWNNLQKRHQDGTATKKEEVPALGHNWDNGQITTAPTCTENGNKYRECSKCH